MKKKILIFLLLMISVIFTSFVFASSIEAVVGPVGVQPIAEGLTNKVLGALQWIGYAFAVGVLMVIGIKYLIASADEKATLKGSLYKYVLGVCLIVTASTLFGIIMRLAERL